MRLVIVFLIILSFSSCKQRTKQEQELQDTLNKSLTLDSFGKVRCMDKYISFEEFRQEFDFISVVYLQNTCDPCVPKFIKWNQKIDSISKPDNYSPLFIIRAGDYGEFMTKVLDKQFIENKIPTIIDPEYKFDSYNLNIPRWIKNSPILIDSENKIKMVGAPFATPEMTELFHSICKN